jgi:hypothetical protein
MILSNARDISKERELLIFVYDAFNRRDIEPILAVMHPELEWPNGMEGAGFMGAKEFALTGLGNGACWIRTLSRFNSRVTATVAS